MFNVPLTIQPLFSGTSTKCLSASCLTPKRLLLPEEGGTELRIKRVAENHAEGEFEVQPQDALLFHRTWLLFGTTNGHPKAVAYPTAKARAA
jgi:hypothetical protein